MTAINLIEKNDGWEIDTKNATIFRCIIDYAFRIELSINGQSLTLAIECEFIISQDGNIYHLDIEDKDRSKLTQGLYLIGQKAQKITIDKDGLIKVQLESEYIMVKPHERYEAWQLRTSNLLIVCIPGGDVAIWDK